MKKKKESLIVILITKTIKIELTNKEKLIFACADGDLEEAKRLLSTGQDVNTTDQRGHSLLWLACYRNQPDIVKLLLEQPNIKVDPSILIIPNIFSTKSFSVNEATSLAIKEQEQDPLWKACYSGEEKFKELLQSVFLAISSAVEPELLFLRMSIFLPKEISNCTVLVFPPLQANIKGDIPILLARLISTLGSFSMISAHSYLSL